ncbi:MAG: DUF2851 family protein [Bacteroidia bacterium]|nr:DUF2851 family protein [Bacteroidia bacterium]
MKEELLHFLWQHKYLLQKELFTVKAEPIQIVKTGLLNRNAGPDFFNAQVKIADKLWVGNIEIHIKSSDWLKHGHQHDSAYHNVILHVVWQHDTEILDPYKNPYPTLEIARLIPPQILKNYQKLMDSKNDIPCSNIFKPLPSILWDNWINRLSIERLKNKVENIEFSFQKLGLHWEELLYQQIAIVFGQKTNAAPFEVLSKVIPHRLMIKYQADLLACQALMLGGAGFLKGRFTNSFNHSLQSEFNFLMNKHQLKPLDISIWKFGRTRPANFPSIRIVQFTECIRAHQNLFQKLIGCERIEDVKRCLQIEGNQTIDIGDLHPNNKKSFVEKVALSDNMLNSILINAVIPVLFFFGKYTQQEFLCERVFAWLQELPAEENHITKQWNKLKISFNYAHETQAMIQLKNYYCNKNNCLACAVGNQILKLE